MKRLIISLLAFATASSCFASGQGGVSYASTTLSNETLQTIKSATSTNTVVTTLTAILVTSATAGGLLKVFNSTYATTASTVAIVKMDTVGYYPFFDIPLKGITYTTTGNSNGVIIIYKY